MNNKEAWNTSRAVVGTPSSNYAANQHQLSQQSSQVGSRKKQPENPRCLLREQEKEVLFTVAAVSGAYVLLGTVLTVTDVQQCSSVVSR